MADLGSNTSLVTALAEIEKKVAQAEIDRNNLEVNIRNKGVEVVPGAKMSNLINKIPDIKAFPTGWDVEKTGEVFDSNITEGDAILYQKYGSWDTQIDLLVNQPTTKYGIGRDFSFSPDGKYLAIASSNGYTVYKISGETFTPVHDYTTSNTTFLCCEFSPDGKHLVIGGTSSFYIDIYRVDPNDVFTRLSTGISVNAYVNDCAFSPDGKYLALGCDASMYLKYYKRDGDTYTPLSVPVNAAGHEGVAFSPDGKYLLAALYNGNYYCVYKRMGDALTLVAYGPTSGLVGNSYGCAFSPDSKFFAIVGSSTPYLAIFKNNGDDTFTRLPNPTVMPGGGGYRCAFSPDGKYLAFPHSTNNPRLIIYKIEGEIFTKVANPSTPPIYDGWGVDFSSNGQYLGIGCGRAPYHYIYRTATKDIVCPYTSSTLPLSILNTKNIGIALESKNIGQQIKVNTFPKFNVL